MPTFNAAPANWTNSSDANFRAWGDYISTQMQVVGIIKTADTGQINWTTVLTPAGTNTYQGYEIRRMSDTLQATAPVFIKIEYGEGGGADGPTIRFQFGSGSNGSGNLTGNLSLQYYSVCGSVAGACLVFGSGDTNRFCMIGGFTAGGGYGLYFGFERSKNAAGADTSEAVLIVGTNIGGVLGAATSTKVYPVWSTTLGDIGPVIPITAPALFPPGATAASGSQVIVAPLMHSKGIFMNPGLNFLGYFTENIAINGTPSIYMYGAIHTYYSLPAASAVSTVAFQGSGGGTEALAMRYE